MVSLHAVAEHVLAAVLYEATGRIGLRVRGDGFSTPPFGDDGRAVGVDGVELVVGTPESERRARLTTLGAAADVVGVELGAPANVYTPTTSCDPEAPLDIDPVSARSVAAWYALGDAALRVWALRLSPDEADAPTLWPEHFDVAIRAGEVNDGASPGDSSHSSPYLYVGPPMEWITPDPFWNATFGATLGWESVSVAHDAVDFFQSGHQHLRCSR